MNINGAQLHLVINHFPVVGFPLAAMALIWGFFRKESQVFLFGIYLSILIWASTLASYLTGEEAEDVLRPLEGFNIDLVHHHEDTAFIAMIVSSVIAIVGLGVLPLFQQKVPWLQKPEIQKRIRLFLIFAVLALSVILALAGHQGGLIRHSEIR